MKRLVVLLLLLIFPLTASAATSNVNVKTLDVSASGKTIKYNGEMENDSVAVMCKLYNSDNKEIDYLSSAVNNHKFEDTFTVSDTGKYTIYCANYEGGEILSKEVEVKEEQTPETLDNIVTYVLIGGISLSILALIAIFYKKQVR